MKDFYMHHQSSNIHDQKGTISGIDILIGALIIVAIAFSSYLIYDFLVLHPSIVKTTKTDQLSSSTNSLLSSTQINPAPAYATGTLLFTGKISDITSDKVTISKTNTDKKSSATSIIVIPSATKPIYYSGNANTIVADKAAFGQNISTNDLVEVYTLPIAGTDNSIVSQFILVE